jgi:putative DNA primase/helicase
MARTDFKTIAAQLLARSREILPKWFPDGRVRGREFVIGNLAGEPGESLSINLDTGKWGDFAAGVTGVDMIDLYAKMHGIGNGEAARRLIELERIDAGPIARTPPPAQDAQPVIPPTDAPVPSMAHRDFGNPSATWCYLDIDGSVIHYVARYETPEGKQIVPWSWVDGRWQARAAAKPRPLYGLDLLGNADRVVVVEGEKAADAARKFISGRAIITWSGGTNAVKQTDWTPLHGRHILLWPDADTKVYPSSHPSAGQQMPPEEQPGMKAMLAVAAILHPHCPSVKIINPVDHADGWDAADAQAEEWTYDRFIQWAFERHTVYTQPAPAAPPAPEPATAPADDDTGDDYLDSAMPAITVGPSTAPTASQSSQRELWSRLDLSMGSTQPHTNLDNTRRIVAGHDAIRGQVWFDTFAQQVYTVWRPTGKPDTVAREWTDADDLELQTWIQRTIGMSKINTVTVHDAVTATARYFPRNELKSWLESLVWDQQTYCSQLLLAGFNTDERPYHQQVGQCWLTSMVARVMAPGCKVDTMPVLEGPQGVGKSTALRVLGGKWFTECHEEITGKDFYGVLSGKWLVEIAEMHAFGRAEINRVKGVLSCQVDRYRVPYGRVAEDYPRQSVFAGTTNRSDWNNDPTGARRFWPVLCGRINLAWIEKMRDQLFAHAVYLYNHGEKWWDVDVAEAKRMVEARRAVDTWEAKIFDWLLDRPMNDVTLTECMEQCLGIPVEKQDRLSQLRAAEGMRLAGWSASTQRTFGDHQRRVWRKNTDSNE